MSRPALADRARASLRRLRSSGDLPGDEADFLLGLAGGDFLPGSRKRPFREASGGVQQEGWANGLPDDVLRALAGRIGGRDMGRARLACRRWARCLPLWMDEGARIGFWSSVGSTSGRWASAICEMVGLDRRTMRLEPYAGAQSYMMQCKYIQAVLERMPQLTDLTLRTAGLTVALVEALGRLTGLTRLDCLLGDIEPQGSEVTAGDVAALSGLRFLSLAGGHLCSTSLSEFTVLTRLEHLALSGFDVDEEELDCFTALTALTQLSFVDCCMAVHGGEGQLPDPAAAWPLLRTLRLPACVTSGWSQPLLHHTSLTDLSLHLCRSEEFAEDRHAELLPCLARLTGLTSLSLACLFGPGPAPYLEALTGLRALDLREARELREGHCRSLSALTGLETLRFPEGREEDAVTGGMLECVPVSVETLSFACADSEVCGGRRLFRLTRLQSLDVETPSNSIQLALRATTLPPGLRCALLPGLSHLICLEDYCGLQGLQKLDLDFKFCPDALRHLPRGLRELVVRSMFVDHDGTGYSGLPPGLRLLAIRTTPEVSELCNGVDIDLMMETAPKLQRLMLGCLTAKSGSSFESAGGLALAGLELLEQLVVYECEWERPGERGAPRWDVARELHPNAPSVQQPATEEEFNKLLPYFFQGK